MNPARTCGDCVFMAVGEVTWLRLFGLRLRRGCLVCLRWGARTDEGLSNVYDVKASHGACHVWEEREPCPEDSA